MTPTKKTAPTADDGALTWPFGTRNYIAFAVALAVIALGFILLAQGSITWAPILLVLGYCILIPLAILIRDKKADPQTTPAPAETTEPVG